MPEMAPHFHQHNINLESQFLHLINTMNIVFNVGELAKRTFIGRLGRADHIRQPHITIWSLPSPAQPLSTSLFPIELSADTKDYDASNIANLWLQLLSIHIQSGNFWRLEYVCEELQRCQAGTIMCKYTI